MKIGSVKKSRKPFPRSSAFVSHVSLCVAIFLLSVSANYVFAQNSIKGIVTDTHKNGIEGVTVSVKGGGAQTSTDGQGYYRITLSVGDSILVFSSIGMRTEERTVGRDSIIDIQLFEGGQQMDEVVIVGFGSQKKLTVTGAISSIQTKEIKQSPAANLAVSLTGRLPGLTAIQTTGEPGRDLTQLFIRGQGTTNTQAPIVLVDGIERDLTYIDPNEVASVTILKDASSTALFGVRGANGVILVTTRRGTADVPEINVSTETSVQGFTRFVNPVNSFDYATLRNLAQRNDGMGDAFSAYALQMYKDGSDPLRYPNTDWKDIMLKNQAIQQRVNLNVSGATKATKYFVNAGYLKQGGMFNTEQDLSYDPSFKLDRYNFRSNIDIRLTESLNAFLNVAGYLESQNSPMGTLTAGSTSTPSSLIIAKMLDLNATIPGPITPDGGVLTSSVEEHPAYGQLNRSGYIKQTRSNVIATFGMEQDLGMLLDGLSVKAVMSFDSHTGNHFYASRNYERYIQVIDPNLVGQDGQDSVYFTRFNAAENTPLAISGVRTFTSLSNFQGYLNYSDVFGEHSLSGLLLYQQQKNIINHDLPYNMRGLSSRVSYGFKNRYFVEFNGGYNGSEQFAKERRFGFFPAISGGWLLSDEPFFPQQSFVDLLKFRASWGLVGNDRMGGSRFLYLDNITVGGGGYSSSLGSGQQVNTTFLRNELLQWEVAKKTNIALELGLFKSLNLILDVFDEKRNNILMTRGTIPVLNGLPTTVLPPVNIGVIHNRGYEVELNYNKRYNERLSFLAKLNFNHAQNRQVFVDEPMLDEEFAYRYRRTGYRIGQAFGYIVDRYFESEDDVRDSPSQVVGGRPTKPGDFKYRDLNGDNIINDRDMAPIGNSSVPEYTFGAAFNVNYRNFDVSVLLQGVSKVSRFFSGRGVFAGTNYVARHLNSWTEERFANGDPIDYPRLTTQVSPNEIANTFFVMDASFIRLKNAEIGYSFSTRLAKKIGARRLRVYANGLNLLTWDKLPTKDFDPELSGALTYPQMSVMNGGLNVIF